MRHFIVKTIQNTHIYNYIHTHTIFSKTKQHFLDHFKMTNCQKIVPEMGPKMDTQTNEKGPATFL